MVSDTSTRPLVPARFARLALLALLVLGLIGCVNKKGAKYDEDRGFYETLEIKPLNAEEEDLLTQGQVIEDSGDLESAVAFYLAVARKYPEHGNVAVKAHTRRVKVYVKMREYELAHRAMVRLVALYKELLQRTRAQAQWDELRHIWYQDIGLGLFFSDDTRTQIADDLDPAIRVFERLLKEEFRGRYSALCLLRIGDCRAHKQDYIEARTHYLRVVGNYQGFQDFHEHEEGIYKAALSTLATMKGAEYDLGLIEASGSDTQEKGALDLCRDYESAYVGGKFADRIRDLKSEIFTVMCWRDYDAGRVYERLGEPRAAREQFRMVVTVWGDTAQFPAQQDYVDLAKEKLRSIGELPDDDD